MAVNPSATIVLFGVWAIVTLAALTVAVLIVPVPVMLADWLTSRLATLEPDSIFTITPGAFTTTLLKSPEITIVVPAGINEMDDQTWDNIIANLLTDEVESRFTAAGKDAGTEMRAFVKALGDIYYSSEATELESTLRGFKDQFKGSFQVLFGKEVSVEDLYQLLVAFKDELPNVIEGNTQYMDKLAFGSNSELVDTVPEVMKDAIRAAIQAPEFTKLNGKLSEIGWNAELLITERINLANEVDSNRNAELALGKALIRSESKLVGVGSTEVYAAQGETITLTDSAKKLYKLVIMDKNATGLVDWVVLQDDIEFGTRIDANNGEINHPVANIKDNNGTLEITPNAAGEIVLVAVRGVGGGSVIDDWVLKLHIIVTE
jgi:hypothetical protein